MRLVLVWVLNLSHLNIVRYVIMTLNGGVARAHQS
jgi:hypothetical protein